MADPGHLEPERQAGGTEERREAPRAAAPRRPARPGRAPEPGEVDWRPEPGKLRGFGLLAVFFFGALALSTLLLEKILWVDLSVEAARTVAGVLGVAAGLAGLAAIVAPRALLPLYWLLTAVSLPIGFVVSRLVMALVYFAVFTPVALLFRLLGRDVLRRRFDREATSYWEPRAETRDRQRYFHQY